MVFWGLESKLDGAWSTPDDDSPMNTRPPFLSSAVVILNVSGDEEPEEVKERDVTGDSTQRGSDLLSCSGFVGRGGLVGGCCSGAYVVEGGRSSLASLENGNLSEL